MGVELRATGLFADMCAPEITFLPAPGTSDLQGADSRSCFWEILRDGVQGNGGVVVEEGISLTLQ